MKIHHVQTTFANRYVLDPMLGAIQRRELIMKESDTTAISYEGTTYERDADGTFDVPDAVGAFLTARPSKDASWHEGPSPFEHEVEPTDEDEVEKPKAPAARAKATR